MLMLIASGAIALGGCATREAQGADTAPLWRVTAYCPCARCCGKFSDGITASGTKADHPLVAAPPEIPFGTMVLVPGYACDGWVPVEDRGGAIKGRRLDVFFGTHDEALEWGVRWLPVRMRKEP